METGRSMETTERLNRAALIKRAFALYNHILEGREVPASEAGALQKLTKESLRSMTPVEAFDQQDYGHHKRRLIKTDDGEFLEDNREFEAFRQDIGTEALLGTFKISGKDAGADFMYLLFGDQTAETFRNVSLLAKELGYHINRYFVASIKELYLFAINKVEIGEQLSANARKALSKIMSFLAAKGKDADRDQLFIEEIVMNQAKLQKELEQKFSENLTSDQVKKKIYAHEKKLKHLWASLRVASLDQALSLVNQILNLSTEVSILKQFEKSGIQGMSFLSTPKILFAIRARAAAYQRLASEKYRQAEDESAKKYEHTADQLWQEYKQITSDQGVTHG